MKKFVLFALLALSATVEAAPSTCEGVDSSRLPTEPLRVMAQANGNKVELWPCKAPPGCKAEDGAIETDWRTGEVIRKACAIISREDQRIYLLWMDGEFQETLPTQWIRP